MAGVTLAEASAHLADAQAALTRARKAVAYGQGDRQLTRARVEELQRQVDVWNRTVRELTDAASSVENPGFMVPKWT